MDKKIPIGMRFSVIHRAFKKEMDRRLRELELTGVQFGVLCELHRLEKCRESEISQRDLEHAARVTHPTMTDIIQRLEKKGFIECRQSKIDGRRKSISTCVKADSLELELMEMDAGVFGELCKGLTEQQISELFEITDVMLENAFEGLKKGSEGFCDKEACRKHPGI